MDPTVIDPVIIYTTSQVIVPQNISILIWAHYFQTTRSNSDNFVFFIWLSLLEYTDRLSDYYYFSSDYFSKYQHSCLTCQLFIIKPPGQMVSTIYFSLDYQWCI